MGRDADEGLEGLGRRHRGDGRIRAQLMSDVGEETGEGIKDRNAVVAQAQRGRIGDRGIREKSFEGAQVWGALAGRVLGVEAEHEAVAVKGEYGGDEINRIVAVVHKRDDWIVPPINNSDRGRRGAKIYS